MNLRKAFTLIEVLVVVAIVGALGAYLFPKAFNKDSRNAAQSQKATTTLIAAQNAKEANVAASVTVIGQAAAAAPIGPDTAFIGKEVPLILSQLQPPDAQALIDSANRRAAVAEGNAALVTKLYGQATQDNIKLVRADEAAKAYREQTDLKLSENAAYELGAERTKYALIALVVLVGAGWAYARIFGIHTDAMGAIVADIRAGVAPLTAIDTNLGPRLHARVQTAARLATPSV